MSDLSAQRRFYAEEVQIAAGLQNPRLVDALATVPREAFLPSAADDAVPAVEAVAPR